MIAPGPPTRPRLGAGIGRWQRRFGDAIDGLWVAARNDHSLRIHFLIAAVVVLLALVVQIERWEWCVVILCIAGVISLELMNSAIERLVKTLHPEHHAGLAAALHMAAAAVLSAAIASIAVGAIVFVPSMVRLWLRL